MSIVQCYLVERVVRGSPQREVWLGHYCDPGNLKATSLISLIFITRNVTLIYLCDFDRGIGCIIRKQAYAAKVVCL